MKISFTEDAWEEFQEWLESDRKIARRISHLIKDIQRQPFEGIGKPEPLKHDLAGYWSRRIDQEHRLVYAVQGDLLTIVQCKGHYSG